MSEEANRFLEVPIGEPIKLMGLKLLQFWVVSHTQQLC
jgi:hypothetical protein